MNRGFSPAQERGLIILLAVAILSSGIALLIPSLRHPRIPPPQEIVVPEVRIVMPRFLSSAPKVDINRAGVNELMTLPGIGKTLAERIIAYREEHGPFTSLDELKKVKGIGEETISRISERVSLGQP